MATGAQEEAYRILRSNLEVALMDLERATVVVTSAQAGEGKTSTTVNLARSLAVAGTRVVLLDLDLRHPDTHRWLGTHNDFGVSDVLLRQRSLPESLQFVGLGERAGGAGLYFLAAGTPVRNPAELLGGTRTPALLDALADQADVVLIDTPPVLPVADTLVIGRMVAGAILVVETRRVPVGAVRKAKDALIHNRTRLLGVVVNKLQQRDARADEGYGYAYGYAYGYPHGSRDGRPSGSTRRQEPEAGDTQPAPLVGRPTVRAGFPLDAAQLTGYPPDRAIEPKLPTVPQLWAPGAEQRPASEQFPPGNGEQGSSGSFAYFEAGPSTNGGPRAGHPHSEGSDHPPS